MSCMVARTDFLEVRVFPLGLRNSGFSRSDQNTILRSQSQKRILIEAMAVIAKSKSGVGERFWGKVQNKGDPHPIPEEEFVPLFWEDPHSLKTFLFSSFFLIIPFVF